MLAFIRRLLRPRRQARTLILTLVFALAILSGCRAARQPEPGGNAAKQATLSLARDAQVQQSFADGRRSLLNENGPRQSFLQQDLDEQKALATDPRYLPELLRLNIDVMEKLGADPALSDRVKANTLKSFRDLAKDPKYKPQLIAIMIDLMKDPQMVAALKSMMAGGGGSGGAPAAPPGGTTPPAGGQTGGGGTTPAPTR